MTTIMPHTREDDGEGVAETNWEDYSKAQLQAELKARDLPTSGTKDELIARLQDSD